MIATASVIRDVTAMQRYADNVRLAGKTIAVVPTMGALHEGHLSLVRLARTRADVVILTIFVNPTQFAPGEDFERYPRTPEHDIAMASDAGATIVFTPANDEVYPPGYHTYISVEKLTDVLEGRVRPGHFRGVATIVAKLFLMTKPHCAVFGQKDAQQVAVIRRMTADLNFDVEIVVAPISREDDGLARSSRNVYLTPAQRKEAPVLYRSLQHATRLIADGTRSSADVVKAMREMITRESSGVIDYISIAELNSLEETSETESSRPLLISLAVRFGSTRLIDNTITP